ncbi:hypothetical protein SS50377_22437 [Spironucleus salmonicida]|uniref:Uncharacterized protein n=1 Tax=Spironucleus salmonicida TaxID=348837 RepID=V6LC76_9EUKA|nr:hypothetical protein SS50377_22437 [Spironucleus salmonicida]|eukprot:EST42072.1 hypothetical protein SS50377_18379 [Spironucleus salmonicida]
MDEFRFGPIYLSPQYYYFTHDYYACIHQQIYLVTLKTMEIIEFPIPSNIVPIFIRVAHTQKITQPHPQIFINTKNGYYIINNFVFQQSTKLEVFVFNDDVYLTNENLGVTTQGVIINNDQSIEIHNFPTSLQNNTICFSNNTIWADGVVYKIEHGDVMNYENNILRMSIEISEFYICEAQLILNYLVVITSNGNLLIFNTQNKEMHQLECFKCEKSHIIYEDWNGSLIANHIYPIHFIIQQDNITLYAIEYPVKNIFTQTTRIFTRKLPISLSQKKEQDNEFLPYNPIQQTRIEDPEFVCFSCNFGLYEKDIDTYSCPGCKNKLEKFM